MISNTKIIKAKCDHCKMEQDFEVFLDHNDKPLYCGWKFPEIDECHARAKMIKTHCEHCEKENDKLVNAHEHGPEFLVCEPCLDDLCQQSEEKKFTDHWEG